MRPNFFQDRITQTRANTAEIIWALIMRVSRILSFHSLIQDQTTAELFYPFCILFFRWCVYLGSSLSPPIDVDVFHTLPGVLGPSRLPAEILCSVPALFVEFTDCRRFSPADDPSQRREVMI